jgi:organic hydroperoxide reductase OsmC/OhrA
MHEHEATVFWQRGDARFTDNRYSRVHEWRFDGGAVVSAAASPTIVPIQFTSAAGVDPEEGFVASLASCHMLWFLSIAAKARWVVDSYTDNAVGLMEKDANGREAITVVTLRPHTTFVGKQPTEEELRALHHEAHEECFLANSVKSEIRVEASSSQS